MLRLLPERWLRMIGDHLAACEAASPADVIVVLGGGRRARLDYGIALLRAGVAPHILLTSSLDPRQLARQGTANSFEEALRLGVPTRSITWLPWPRNTYEEGHAVRQAASDQGLRRIMVVTEAYHSHRALRVFRRAFDSTGMLLSVTCPPGTEVRLDGWWRRRKDAQAVLGELLALVYYRLRYRV